MTIKTSIELNPWQVPNFATVKGRPGLKQDGMQPAASISVGDLESETLDALAFAWLQELYKKSGHTNPFTIIRGA